DRVPVHIRRASGHRGYDWDIFNYRDTDATANNSDDGRKRSACSCRTAGSCYPGHASALGCAARSGLGHGRFGYDDLLWRRKRLGRRRMVIRADSIPDWAWVFDRMETGKQKGHSASAPGTLILQLWSSLMRISLREFLPMTINTPS